MNLRSSLLGVAMVSTAIGCSSGGGDGGGGGIQGKLSTEQEAALQAWIQSPLKSCEAIEVVGGGATTPADDFTMPGFPQPAPRPRDRDAIAKGVDLSVLHAKTKGSLWVGPKSANGAFAVLSGGASGFTSGIATSKFEQTVEINGSSQSVKVETESSGFDCVVKVNGVERARLLIAKEVEIALAGDLAELSSPSSFPSARITTSTFSNRGFVKFGARAARFDSGNISDLISKSMKSETAREVALQGLGFTPDQIKKHFVMAPGLRPQQLALDLGTASGSAAGGLQLAARSGFVLTETAVDSIPVEGQARDLKFVVLLATEKSQVGAKEFTSGAQTVMAITRQLRLENRTGEFVVSDSGLGSISEKAAGTQIAEKCALDRATEANFLYFPERASRLNGRMAKRSEIYGPCSVYDRDVIGTAEKSGSMLTALNAIYRSVQPSDLRGTGFSYEDWEDSISYYLVKGLLVGSSDRLVDSTIVSSPIMILLDQMMMDIRQEASGTAISEDYRRLLSGLVTGLSAAELSGNPPSTSFLRGMARTAIRAGAGFESSFGSLVRIAVQDWRRASPMVSWADSMMTASYIGTARAVSAEASLIGYRPYFDEVHSRLFEVQPSETDLKTQLDRFRGFRTQLDRFPQLKPVADVISTSLLKSRVQSVDYPRTIEAAAKLASGDADLVAVYMNALKTGDGVTEFDAIRNWALALTTSDQQAIASVVANGKALGFESESRQKLREAVSARVGTSVLQSMANAGGLAKAFIAAEASRASGSTRDTFYESKAKELAKRIFLQNFSASDVQALETFAKVAGSDLMCEGRQTVSSRLDCAGLQRFTKEGDGLLSDRFQGRYVSLAARMQVWFGQLVPANDHLSIRRKLKSALFPTFNDTPWATCDAQSYQMKFQALDKAVGSYLVAIGDFVTRSRAERDVQTAMDARCP